MPIVYVLCRVNALQLGFHLPLGKGFISLLFIDQWLVGYYWTERNGL